MSKFISHKDEAISEMRQKVTTALTRCGFEMERYAKENAPVDQGRLRNSIGNYVDDDTVYVGTNVEYAPPIEFGHSQEVGRYVPAIDARLVNPFVPARPFLAPAVNDHIPQYRDIIEEELKR